MFPLLVAGKHSACAKPWLVSGYFSSRDSCETLQFQSDDVFAALLALPMLELQVKSEAAVERRRNEEQRERRQD